MLKELVATLPKGRLEVIRKEFSNREDVYVMQIYRNEPLEGFSIELSLVEFEEVARMIEVFRRFLP